MTDKLTGSKDKENILGKSIIENPLNTHTHTHTHITKKEKKTLTAIAQ